MSVLVTGAAGFIGSHVCDALLARGHEVVGLDDLSGGFAENVPERVRFHEGSVLDTGLLERVFRERHIEYVFHLAAYAAEGLSHFIRRFNYTNNVIGSVNLINASVQAGVKCFVFSSSIAVYGPAQVPMHEATTPQPEDPYGIAKYAVELDLAAARRMFGLQSVIFRPHNVYGERQNIGDRYRNVIGIFMNQLMRGEAMTIFGDGSQTRAFTHVSDIAPLMARAIETPAVHNRTFNIGSDQVHTVLELAHLVARAMGKEPVIRHVDARKEVAHASADHREIGEAFGQTTPLSLEEGLSRMARWAVEHGPRASAEFSAIEVEKNLPSSWRSR